MDHGYSCSGGYKLNGQKCTKTITVDENITYYRYATRTCTGGSVEVRWSMNSNDQTLLKDGYTKTGNKRAMTNYIEK